MTLSMRSVGFAFILLLVRCASQELHREGVIDIDNGRVEEGLKKLQQAVLENPDNLSYRYDLQARRQASRRCCLPPVIRLVATETSMKPKHTSAACWR